MNVRRIDISGSWVYAYDSQTVYCFPYHAITQLSVTHSKKIITITTKGSSLIYRGDNFEETLALLTAYLAGQGLDYRYLNASRLNMT
jgi:hypothetical protein